MYAILSMLGDDNVGGRGDLELALRRASRLKKRRGLVVVVSDVLADDDWMRPMRSLAQRHDVVAVEVYDPREVELADVGMVKMVDPETGSSAWVDTGTASARSAFSATARHRRQELAREIAAAGVTHIALSTSGDWAAALVSAVLARRHTLAASGRA